MPTLSVLLLNWNDFRLIAQACRNHKQARAAYRTLVKVTLRLHDTAARAVREFQPVTPGRVSLYLCGATVQAVPHIGHLRSVVCFDILIRWLAASGYSVTYCRNVTDIDDKILRAANAEGTPWWALAERNQRAFSHAYDALGCRPPDVEPRATGHIPEMTALIRRLIDGGHAYTAGGDVYFDVHSVNGYGTLSGQRPADMRPADDIDTSANKRDPRDFALWKGAKPGEPLSWNPQWETPWGPGRPGWHLECSAMSTKYLGPVFDIHGGGIDLVFPHHENERAQSHAAGDDFAQYWLHNGLVGLSGQKMSKSGGNILLVTEILTQVRPQELRYYLGQAHYRSVIEYSDEALEEAASAYQRIERFATRAQRMLDADPGAEHAEPAEPTEPAELTEQAESAVLAAPVADLPISFTAAMDDDLGVPAALAAVHAAVRDGNYALASGDRDGVAGCLTQVRSMLTVLGLDPLDPMWSTGDSSGRLFGAVDGLVRLALRQREAARADGDYASADSIRDTLESIGVVVQDTPEGPRWELKR
jgi:cysteinyl-tRNA synthetase